VESQLGFVPGDAVVRLGVQRGKARADPVRQRVAVVARVPAPSGDPAAPLRALIFDSIFDTYRGAVPYFRVVDGSLKIGDRIRLIGSGKVTLTPDIAYVTIGVHTEGKDASQAVSENNSQTQAVIDALEKSDIASEDIQTTNFSIYPQQQLDDRGQPTGEITYIVNNSVYITVRDLESIGDVLNVAVEAGANQISGIQFDISDAEYALAEAQEMAVANAQAQAENLAQASNLVLGDIQNISTFGGATPYLKYDGIGGGAAVMEAASVPVSSGQMIISVEVSVIYEIR